MPSTPLEIAEQLTTDAFTAANHLMMALIEAGMSLCQPSTVIGEMYLQSRGNGLLSPAVDTSEVSRMKMLPQSSSPFPCGESEVLICCELIEHVACPCHQRHQLFLQYRRANFQESLNHRERGRETRTCILRVARYMNLCNILMRPCWRLDSSDDGTESQRHQGYPFYICRDVP